MAMTEPLKERVAIWLDTWAPHCGSPRRVFEGQFRAMLREIFDELERRAVATGTLCAAIDDVRKELGAESLSEPKGPIATMLLGLCEAVNESSAAADFAAKHGWAIGDIAEAAYDITSGLFQSDVLVKEGTRLIVRGPSGNALHPIGVSKQDDEHYHLAVSASNLRRPGDGSPPRQS